MNFSKVISFCIRLFRRFYPISSVAVNESAGSRARKRKTEESPGSQRERESTNVNDNSHSSSEVFEPDVPEETVDAPVDERNEVRITEEIETDGEVEQAWIDPQIDKGDSVESEFDNGNVPLPSNACTSPNEGARELSMPPRETGGRRGTRSVQQERSTTKTARHSKPELTCQWDPSTSCWNVYVVAESGVKSVAQGTRELPFGDNCACLDSYTTSLSVISGDDVLWEINCIDNSKIAIFKMSVNWRGVGRKINRMTKGHFIVIAPAHYTQLEHVPHAPERCGDSSFSAFYFHRGGQGEDDASIGFNEHPLSMTQNRFALTGGSIYDSSEKGTLFVNSVPKLRADSTIMWVRVGEETEKARQGKKAWLGQNFEPQRHSLSEILNGRQGRFFVRVYENSRKLVDTGEFRYMRDLKAIRVGGENFSSSQLILPGSDGNEITTIEFIAESGSTVSPHLRTESEYMTTRENSIIVKPNPLADRVACWFSAADDEVEVVVDLPHIWWTLASSDADPFDWQATPFALSRDQLRELATSNYSVFLKLPSSAPRAARVGLDCLTDRSYRRTEAAPWIRIPLIDFIDYRKIDDQRYENATLDVELAGTSVTLVNITPDPIPAIRYFRCDSHQIVQGEDVVLLWETCNADDECVSIEPEIGTVAPTGTQTVSLTTSTSFTLRIQVTSTIVIQKRVDVEVRPLRSRTTPTPWVRYTHGWRPGKGFSRGELQIAGISVDLLITMHALRFDKRRGTIHARNVKALKAIRDD